MKERIKYKFMTILVLMIILLFTFSFAEEVDEVILAPNMVRFGEDVLVYNTGEVPDSFWKKGIDFSVNKQNEIRLITITDEQFETYNNISVGDSVDKVKLAFNYEQQLSNRWCVIFQDTTEINVEEVKEKQGKLEDSCIWIEYLCTEETQWQDGIVECIRIYDHKYARMMI